MSSSSRPRVLLEPGTGNLVSLGGVGVQFKLSGDDTGGAFSIVEHPVEPRVLIPSHVHRAEDEFSYVLEGLIGVRIGDHIIDAPAGSYVIKPRNVPHTFWNPTDQPARLIEIISPPGFEQQFAEMGVQRGPVTAEFGAYLGRKYQISPAPADWADWIKELTARLQLHDPVSRAI